MAGSVNAIVAVGTGSGPLQMELSRLKALRVTMLESWGFELGRVARSFVAGTNIIANAVAPVTAIPTTTAAWVLNNANAAGSGKLLHIKAVGLFYASGTAGADGAALMGGVTPTVLATQLTANGTGHNTQATRGFGAVNHYMDVSKTVPSGIAWGLLAPSTYIGAATVTGLAMMADVRHLGLVVPPQFAFAASALGDTGTTAKYGITVWYDEIDGDLP